MNSKFKIPDLNITNNIEKPSSEIRPGRPSIEFKNKSKRSQRRESADISAQCKHHPLRIVMACRHAARQSGHKDLIAILKGILNKKFTTSCKNKEIAGYIDPYDNQKNS